MLGECVHVVRAWNACKHMLRVGGGGGGKKGDRGKRQGNGMHVRASVCGAVRNN